MKRLILAIAAAATTLFAPAAIKTQLDFESDGTAYESAARPSATANYPFADFGSKYLKLDDLALDDGYDIESVFAQGDPRVFDMYVQFTAMTETPEFPTEAKIAVYADGDRYLYALSANSTNILGQVDTLNKWVRLTIVSVSGGYDIYVDGDNVGSVSADENATTVEFTGSGKLDNFVARTTDPFGGEPDNWIAKEPNASDPEQYYTNYTAALTAALNGASLTFNGETEMDGTAEHPFEIRSLADLKAFQSAVADGKGADKCYVQTADIALDDAWPGIGIQNGKDIVGTAAFDNGAFKGTYDGGDCTVSNFQMVDGLDYCGFFNSVSNATIRNLKISYKDGSFAKDMVAANEACGATFVGVAKGSTLQNLTSLAGTVSCTKGFGGIVGYLMAGSTVESCTNNVNLTSTASNKAGGIAMITQAGSGVATIRNCQNNGTTTGNASQKGGIVGYVGIATAIDGCSDTAGSTPSILHNQGQTVTVSGVITAPAGVLSYTTSNNNAIDGLDFATVDNDVATFVKAADLVDNGEYVVMGPKAAYAFTQAGTISFDQSLATATVTADTSTLVLSDETVENVTTYTAVAGVASITKNNVTTLYATLQDAVTAANADADVNTVKLVGAATGAVSIPEGITVQLVAGYSLNGVTSLSGAGVLAMPWGESPQQVLQLLCQQSTWGGTLFIQGVDINSAINLTLLGNANSTVCFNNAGCAFTANNTAVHNIKALEIGPDGLDFIGEYSSGTFTFPCALTGTGMLKIAAKNSSGGTALKVAKFTGDVSDFAGSISFANDANCAVYFGDSLGNGNCISVGAGKSVTVAAGKTWTAPAGFVVKGNMTVNGTLSAGNEKLYGDGTITFNAPTSLVVANSWTGTYNANFKAANNAVFYIPVNASATTVINGVNGEFGGLPKFGSGAPTVAGPVTLNANWTVADGWTGASYTTTFAKLSGSGNLTVNGSGSGDTPIYYTITELSDYTGTIGGRRGNFTISKVNVATKPASRAIVVKTNIGTNGSINDNVPLYVAGVDTGKTLTYDANGASGAGLYAPQMEVAIVIPPVANTTVSVTANGTPVEIVDGKITVDDGAAVVLTYTSTTHEVTGGTIEFTAADGYTVDVSDVTTTAYVATFNGTHYTSLAAAVPAWAAADAITAYMNPIVLIADVDEDVTIPVNINVSAVPLQMQGSATINGTVTISEGATFQPLATVLFGGDVVVNGTLVRAGVATLNIGGDLTLADGATLGATTLDTVNPVYAVVGDVEVEGVLNISLTSQTLEAGTYKVVTGTSVARDEGADVVVFLNEEENDNWVLSSTTTELTITGAAATVGGEKFATFAEAVTAAGGVEAITLLANASWTLTVGETLNVQAGEYTITVTPPAGYALVETPVSEGVVAYTTQQYVAKLKNPNVGSTTYANEVYYTSLKAALADVVEQSMAVYADYKAVVTLLADDHVSFGAVTVEDGVPSDGSIVIDKAVVINGAGYTVYGNTNANILNATGSATPGYDMAADLVDGSNLLGFFVKSGNVTFQNITLTEFGDTAYVNKFGYTPIQTASAYAGTLTLTNVNFSKFNRTAVCVRGGTLSMTGGTVSGGTVNKNNGDYFQQPLEVRGGTATIDGVTITGGNDIAGNGGGAIVAWNDITVTNVVVNFTGIGIWSDGGTVTVSGDNTAVTTTGAALFAEEGYAIVVSAGTFNGAIAKDGNANSSISITGGTLSVDPSAYVAAGYKAVESAGVWTVGVDAGGFPGGADGKTFTIDDAVQTALEAKLPAGKALTDTVEGTTSGLTYAQAYALDLFDEDTGTVEDVKPTIEIVNGTVVVSLDATAKAGYKVMLNVYEKSSLTAQWPTEPTKSYELDSAAEAAGFAPSAAGAGFYKVGVTIEDAE